MNDKEEKCIQLQGAVKRHLRGEEGNEVVFRNYYYLLIRLSDNRYSNGLRLVMRWS